MDVVENTSFEVGGDDLAFLQRTFGGNLERRRDGWAVTRIVGHIALPSGEIFRIRSAKASGASVLAWMAFVDPALAGLRSLGRVPEAIDSGDVGALAARLFFLELFTAFGRHGIGRRYLRTQTLGAKVRGRIDFATLSRRGGDLSKLPCRVWERLPDTPLNRLLAAAVESVGRDPILRRSFATDVGRARAVLSGVPSIPSLAMLGGNAKLERAELPFSTAQALALILLRGSLLGEGRNEAGIGFVVNLETLFERTVERAITLSGLPSVPKSPVPYIRISAAGARQLGQMQMDVFIPASPLGPLVVDAKYKSSISSSNLQQMVTYCYVTGAERAILVLPGGSAPLAKAYEVKSIRPGLDDRPGIVIHVLEIETDAPSVEQWRSAAIELGQQIQRLSRSLASVSEL